MTGPSPASFVADLRAAREFDLVRVIAATLGDRAVGLGDDAAVLPPTGDLSPVVSVDAAVEGVHFRRGWLTPREIGYRATAAAMSDLAAMAATPQALLVALALPDAWEADLAEIAAGIGELAAFAGAAVVGGNLSAARELSITTTVIGTARAPLLRTGLRPGDRLFVTGRLGGPAAALRALLRQGAVDDAAVRRRFAHPVPRIREARWLADHGASAAIDVSDGLLADAEHLAAASRVVVELDADRIPRLPGASAEDATTGGEEYEILVGVPPIMDVGAFASTFDVPLTEVGRVLDGGPPAVRMRGSAQTDGRVAKRSGHDHFSS